MTPSWGELRKKTINRTQQVKADTETPAFLHVALAAMLAKEFVT